ncbi:MAG: dihydropteroate synthase [Dehalogenimonas sp.]
MTEFSLSHPKSTIIRGIKFPWGQRTFIMGVVNVTSDSFSGDGLADNVEAAVAQARRMVAEGADIIDVGGESTRPDALEVIAEEEMSRVIPVIQRLKSELKIPVSIDTYKAEVAEAAAVAGADLLNDVWGLKRDSRLAEVAAHFGLPIVLTASQRDAAVLDIIPAVVGNLKWAIEQAEKAGVSPENIIVDPGFGFGKTVGQNLEIIRRLGELRSLGKPIMLGVSRKSTIGRVLGDMPAEERLEGTLAADVLGIAYGADIIRVHDIGEHVRAARVADAVVRGWSENG